MPEQTAAPQPAQKVETTELVRFRNFFYHDGYSKSLTIFLISIGVNIALVALIVLLIVTRPVPTYFATQPNGSLIPDEPVSQPIDDLSNLFTWSTRVVLDSYSYNFANWRYQLENVQQYYTASGFQNFLDAIKQSGNLDNVVAKKYVVSATVVDVPNVLNDGVLQGRYAWKIQIPMRINYSSATDLQVQPILVTMTVARALKTEKPEGFAIVQFKVEDREEH